MPWQILELCSCSCCQLQQLLRVLPSCAGNSLRLKDFMICTFMEIIFRIRFTARTFSLSVFVCVCARQQLKIFNYHGKKLSDNMHNISHMTRERERKTGREKRVPRKQRSTCVFGGCQTFPVVQMPRASSSSM